MKGLKVNAGNGCSIWMCLMLLKCTLKMVKMTNFILIHALPQWKILLKKKTTLYVKVALGEISAASYKLVTLCSLSLGSQTLWNKILRWQCFVALPHEWWWHFFSIVVMNKWMKEGGKIPYCFASWSILILPSS